MIALPAVIPTSWKIGAVLLLAGALVAVDAWRVHAADQGGFNRATTERAARDGIAVVTRVHDNVAAAAKNADINKFLTKDHDEKLAPVVQRIYVDRVRVGPGICGPATAAKTDDAGSGNGADPTSRVVSPASEGRIRELDVEVEKHLATGRTCQAWGREHGFIP
jgi:hypothetical protein